MLLPLDADELLTTTRSVRRRLDLSRPYERAVVEECLTVALQAPNGSNFQLWQWVVVDDAAKRRALQEIYAASMADYERTMPPDPRHETPDQKRIAASVYYLRDHLAEVPVHVIPCLGARTEGLPTFAQASLWGSILPAAWSFQIALRARGLGSAWTTITLLREREVAELLGIPFERVTQAGLLPVAFTRGTTFRPAPRRPLATCLHWNGWEAQ
jgi:nitroreductase